MKLEGTHFSSIQYRFRQECRHNSEKYFITLDYQINVAYGIDVALGILVRTNKRSLWNKRSLVIYLLRIVNGVDI